jgi:hypothetical protein
MRYRKDLWMLMDGVVCRQPSGTGDDGSSQSHQGEISATVIINENSFEAAASIRVEHRKPFDKQYFGDDTPSRPLIHEIPSFQITSCQYVCRAASEPEGRVKGLSHPALLPKKIFTDPT